MFHHFFAPGNKSSKLSFPGAKVLESESSYYHYDGYCKYYIGPFSPLDPNPNHIPKSVPKLNLTNSGCCDATLAGSFQTIKLVRNKSL